MKRSVNQYIPPQVSVQMMDAVAGYLVIDSPGGDGEAGLIDDGGDYYV
jgi:hypothetical protein